MPFSWGWNWRNSTPHWLLLQSFRKLRLAEKHPTLPEDVSWHTLLGEPPEKAVERFLVQNLLVKATLFERMEAHFTVADLQELLRARKLSLSGSKTTLINRLIQADAEGVRAALPAQEWLRCSDYGLRLADEFLADPQTPTRLSDKKIVAAAKVVLFRLLVDGAIIGVVGNVTYQWLRQYLDEREAQLLRQQETAWKVGTSTRITSGLTIEWCRVPSGYFWMGSEDAEASDDEKPRHRLYLPDFYIARYPITNAQYQVFVQASGRRSPFFWENNRYPTGTGNYPVWGIFWSDCVAFCQWAARLSGLPIRLPAEAEWEKAAGASHGYRYPWGSDWRSGHCNSVEAQINGTTPVGYYPLGASPCGALDMAGNVWEWTSTAYKPYLYRAEGGREGMSDNDLVVLRGGAYWSPKERCRVAARIRSWLNDRTYGFRVAVSPFISGL